MVASTFFKKFLLVWFDIGLWHYSAFKLQTGFLNFYQMHLHVTLGLSGHFCTWPWSSLFLRLVCLVVTIINKTYITVKGLTVLLKVSEERFVLIIFFHALSKHCLLLTRYDEKVDFFRVFDLEFHYFLLHICRRKKLEFLKRRNNKHLSDNKDI